ncbi:MAG: hypothetical protein HN846_01055 [Candidatus Pacebacteria bacterium]|nr:hypothetical protein [Candidatus Paceibacterota bacterium]MBT3512239.1 hypothetical protein [Candidatus Paceibacterota bacterium]MBT4359317.1 hypothetical protein [Candidatus Paceibacterota bacterium]MBT4680932.1 hypothetical protein [Candidatus Paceibacterota bacterium]MBT6898942.1 hypothetical protein [Candidatus Paceibacterota bacterium]
MPKKTADTIIVGKKDNQLQKAWRHLSKKQRITLGVLSFIVFVLPLSLFIIKKQTNITPKATFVPITPPVTPSLSPTPSPNPLYGYCERCSYVPNNQGAPNLKCLPGLICGPDESKSCSINPETGEEICATGISAFGKCVKPGENIAVCENYPSPFPSPSIAPSPPSGCYYQQVQCFQAPCDPILVCPSPSPIPSPTSLSDYCESCNNSLPPYVNGSRCMEGLTCKSTSSETCHVMENGETICTAVMGAPGLCVNAGETTDVCQNKNPISLAGDKLPDDPRISWHQLTVNYPLLRDRQETTIYKENYTSGNSRVLPIEDGYGQFYIIHPAAGKKLEALVRELNSSSYIKAVLYGPDKKKIIEAGTRIKFTPENNGPYYLVAHTFDHQSGQVEIAVSDEFRKYLFPYVKRIDKDMELLWDNYGTIGRVGRKSTDFFLQVPWLKNINEDIYVVYERQTDDGQLRIEVPRVKITQTCPLTQESTSLPITVERMGSYELNPLRTTQVKISPQSSAYFPPGYDYRVELEFPDPNKGWAANFSTTSQSGLMADLNDDNAVDLSDYSLLVSELMQSNNSLIADLNCDGIVDISDYSLLISNISL